jgi:hypothetical protein
VLDRHVGEKELTEVCRLKRVFREVCVQERRETRIAEIYRTQRRLRKIRRRQQRVVGQLQRFSVRLQQQTVQITVIRRFRCRRGARFRAVQGRTQGRDVLHGEAQRGDLGQLLVGTGHLRRLHVWDHAPQRFESLVYLPHAVPLPRVGRLAAVLAERRRFLFLLVGFVLSGGGVGPGQFRGLLGRPPHRARPQRVLVLDGRSVAVVVGVRVGHLREAVGDAVELQERIHPGTALGALNRISVCSCFSGALRRLVATCRARLSPARPSKSPSSCVGRVRDVNCWTSTWSLVLGGVCAQRYCRLPHLNTRDRPHYNTCVSRTEMMNWKIIVKEE